ARDAHFGIFLEPLHDGLPRLDLEAEVIEAGADARVPLQQREAHDAVAQVAAVGIVLALFVRHAGRDLLHAENIAIEAGGPVVVFGVDGDVTDAREAHGGILLEPDYHPARRVVNGG